MISRSGVRIYLLEGSGSTYQYAFRDTALDSLEEGKCEACGRTRSRWHFSGAHRFLLEGGPKYPDRLEFTGAGGAPLLLSRRAADAFREHGITGIGETAPVQTARESGDLPEVAPDYLLARICGRIELDLPKMGLKKKKLCRVCGGFEWNRQRLSPLLLDASAWDGSDLCRVDSIPGYVVCTDNVVALVKKQKLKGFSFRAL
jgi:hypothetical protein